MAHGDVSKVKRLPAAIARRRIEVISAGADEVLQVTAGDPYGNLTWVGLRVPALVNVTPQTRYLYTLASFSIGEGRAARIVGLRNGWTIGAVPNANRVVEMQVTTPGFKFPDGNISWHLRVLTPGEEGWLGDTLGPVTPPLPNFRFRTSDTPALLYESATFAGVPGFFTDAMTAYTPPHGGQPYGSTAMADYGTFYGLRCQWADSYSWQNIDAPIEGPARVVLYASVQQTDPATRVALTAPAVAATYSSGMPPEEAFLLNFPLARIWRVMGALAVELDDDR